MLISDDEFDYHSVQEPQSSMSKAELRKTHKPIMEKRRRARINHCLNEIKSLILEAMNKDPARHSKLEKADILEMAVKHLQNVQRQHLALAMATDPSVLRKFRTGFNECAGEIDKYIGQIEGVDGGLKERMTSHLQKCISGIEQVSHFNFPGFSNPFASSPAGVFARTQPEPTTLGDQNNNATRIQIPQSIQLIPSRLPSGEIALLLPNSSNLPIFPTISRPSAFAAVIPSSTTVERPPTPPSPPRIVPEKIGFRPVPPSKSQEQQVAQISSTSLPVAQSCEVKTIKFPIHSYPEKRKVAEPLCIITNQSERFKQAQAREDSRDFEENRQQGVKRKYVEIAQGLLTVAPQDYSYPAAKMMRLGEASTSSVDDGQVPSGSKDNNESGDMWRPW